MRTNDCNVTENAEFNIDQKKYGENLEHVYGKKPSPFCDKCEKRHCFCECEKDKEDGT